MSSARRLAAPVLSLALVAAAPGAASAADVEGIWSYSGGEVAIAPDASGVLRSRVLTESTVYQCKRVVGMEIWRAFAVQPDGQAFEEHVYKNDDCTSITGWGKGAMRVLVRPDGTKTLRACSNTPDDPVQPSIAADGTVTDEHNDNCRDSDYVGPVPAPPKLKDVVTLPATKACRSRRSFRITLREPRPDRLSSATVSVSGRKRTTVKRSSDGRLRTRVSLKDLPRGRYTVRIRATTTLGRTITGTRRYRTCARRSSGGGGRL